MIKSILSVALAAAISAAPAANIEIHTAKAINHYAADNISYTAFVTRDGNIWVAEGDYKHGRYYLIFDNKGTASVYDDEIICIKKAK